MCIVLADCAIVVIAVLFLVISLVPLVEEDFNNLGGK